MNRYGRWLLVALVLAGASSCSSDGGGPVAENRMLRETPEAGGVDLIAPREAGRERHANVITTRAFGFEVVPGQRSELCCVDPERIAVRPGGNVMTGVVGENGDHGTSMPE